MPGKPHILIVEDDVSLCMLYRALFVALGWAGTVALTVADAIEHLNRPDSADFDAVLIDYWLPDGSGLDVLAEVRRLGLSAKVIVMTAAIERSVEEKILAAGPDRFEPKPYDHIKLTAYFEGLRAEAIARRGKTP